MIKKTEQALPSFEYAEEVKMYLLGGKSMGIVIPRWLARKMHEAGIKRFNLTWDNDKKRIVLTPIIEQDLDF